MEVNKNIQVDFSEQIKSDEVIDMEIKTQVEENLAIMIAIRDNLEIEIEESRTNQKEKTALNTANQKKEMEAIMTVDKVKIGIK